MGVSVTKVMRPVVVDARDHIAGRLSSYIAELLMDGNRVIVVNCEKALLSGGRKSVLKEWSSRLEIGSIVHPKHGPYHPRTPDKILTRMIRGMVPRRKNKGVRAMKRLRVYVGVPKDYEKFKTRIFEKAKAMKPSSYYTPIGDVASALGWRG